MTAVRRKASTPALTFAPGATGRFEPVPAPLTLTGEPYAEDTPYTYSEIVVTANVGHIPDATAIKLRMNIGSRECAIATGQPVQGLLYLPDYEREDYRGTWAEPVSVNVDKLAALAEAIGKLARECRVRGILPTTSKEA